MRKMIKTIMVAAILFAAMSAMSQPNGFSYQAVVRDANGNLVSNATVSLRLTLTDQTEQQTMYQETHNDVATNAYGVLSVTIGEGTPVGNKSLSNVVWTNDVFLKVEADINNGTNYTSLGTSKIQAVPVALYAASTGSGTISSGVGESLFEVKDKEGNVVFAVYPEGVHVYVDPEAGDGKIRRSGFLITGRDATKSGMNNDLLAVDGAGTHVYVDAKSGDDKIKRSGFLITGRDATKDEEPLFAVDSRGTTGDNTAAFGQYAEATGYSSTAMGYNAKASGDYSTAFGINSKAEGEGGFSAGRECVSSGRGAVAMGHMAEATDDYAFALGEYTKASKNGACAIGSSCHALGIGTFAIGSSCTADSSGSVAMGFACKALGNWCMAFGNDSEALNHGAVAIGKSAKAEGMCSFSTGEGSHAKGDASVAFGDQAKALGSYSVAIGPENVSAEQESVTLGKWLYAKSTGETVVGSANDTTGYGVSGPIWDFSDRLFTIGNGDGRYSRSNAMVVLKNGKIGIGTSKPDYLLEVNGDVHVNNLTQTSDARLKQNITPLANSLQKVLQLRGVNYYWKPQAEIKEILDTHEKCEYPETLQIGVIAQEVEQIFPELVSTNSKGIKSVDYTKMTPILIEAVKEQQGIIESQQAKIDNLQQQMDELKRMIEEMKN